MNMRAKLLISFALVLLIPSFVIGGIAYQTAKTKVGDQLTLAAEESEQMVDNAINEILGAKVSDMDVLANVLRSDDPTQTNIVLKEFQTQHPELDSLYLVTDKGKVVAEPQKLTTAVDDLKKSPWYQDAVNKKGLVIISEPFASSGHVDVTLARTMQDGHGVIAVYLNLQSLIAITKEISIGQNGFMVILDQQRRWVYHPTQKIGTVWQGGATVDKMYASNSGIFSYTSTSDVQAKDMVFGTNKLTGWKIASTMYNSEITDAANPIYQKTLLVLIIAVVLGGLLAYTIVRSITRKLQIVTQVSERISNGDLTERVNINTNDEIGQLSQSFNRMVEALRQLILEVSQTASQLAASSEELTANAELSSQTAEQTSLMMQELAEGTEHQVNSIEETEQTVQEMSASVQQMTASAQTVSEAAVQASDLAQEGNQAIQKAVQQMQSINQTVSLSADSIKSLGEHAQNIGVIVEAITTIAEQTNLLALNAAIESARAGEHGRGFAVVADEVRKLAEQSSDSAKQIAEYITTIQVEMKKSVEYMEAGTKEVALGIEVVHVAGESFEQIQDAVSEVAIQIREVSGSIREMATGADQVVAAMGQINEVTEKAAVSTQTVSATTEEQLATMEEIASSAATLSQMAEQLEQLITKFKL